MPPPGRSWEQGSAGLCGRTPPSPCVPGACGLCSEAWPPGGSVGIGCGAPPRGCLRHRPALSWLSSPTRWRALPRAALAKQYAPGPASWLRDSGAALPVLGSLLPQPHTPFPWRAVLWEGLSLGRAALSPAAYPPGCWPGPRGARAPVRALEPLLLIGQAARVWPETPTIGCPPLEALHPLWVCPAQCRTAVAAARGFAARCALRGHEQAERAAACPATCPARRLRWVEGSQAWG